MDFKKGLGLHVWDMEMLTTSVFQWGMTWTEKSLQKPQHHPELSEVYQELRQLILNMLHMKPKTTRPHTIYRQAAEIKID